MNGPTLQPHWIRQNETTQQPRRFIWLDSEAGETEISSGWSQAWSLAVTAFDDTNPRRKTPKPTEWATHKTPDELWQWVSDRTVKGRRTILCAHNLGYDLRITKAFELLPALGWVVDLLHIDSRNSWVRWRRDGATLCMVDSGSWLPMGLGVIGDLIGRPKPDLPAWSDDLATWEHRCQEDVAILREAMLRVWGWMERADLGVWQMTGAGCAWSAWRHRFLTHKVLAAVDETQAARERKAGWTGRCEAWRHGVVARNRYVELDLEMAYATIALQCDVPTRMVTEIDRPTVETVGKWMRTMTVLAEVTVTTKVPCLPAEVDGHVLWPVGTFDTTLWGPELQLALDTAESVTINRAWSYRTAPALQEWAEWIIPLAQGVGDGTDPLVRKVAKQWSRQLIGRFGLRYKSWESAGTSPVANVQVIPGINLDTGEEYRWLQVGHDLFTEGAATDSPNAVPAIMAFIMSECRVRLWRLMTAAGLDHVVYVDTDSLIVDRQGATALQAGLVGPSVGLLRSKGSWAYLEVHGPRQIVLGDRLRAAGVPKDATRTDAGTWEAVVWRSLAESLKRGEADRVVLTRRTATLRGTDRRRLHVARGRTASVVLPAPATSNADSDIRP